MGAWKFLTGGEMLGIRPSCKKKKNKKKKISRKKKKIQYGVYTSALRRGMKIDEFPREPSGAAFEFVYRSVHQAAALTRRSSAVEKQRKLPPPLV